MSSKISAIVGPSHAVRWQWHVRDGVVPCPIPSNRIYGLGGIPIWSQDLKNKVESFLSLRGKVGVLVPDFRFGNEIALSAKKNELNIIDSKYLGINPLALKTCYDIFMLERCMSSLREWNSCFGSRVRYVFWCLFGRQVNDRMLGKYCIDGKYLHPVFNYSEIVSKLENLDIVDLSPLLKRPMHDVHRLFIDFSLHPSIVGYLFLSKILFDDLDASTAYDRAVFQLENELITLAANLKNHYNKPVLLTGKSAWLDVVLKTLGSTSWVKLADAGLIIISTSQSSSIPDWSKAVVRYNPALCHCIIISAGGMDLNAKLDSLFKNRPGFWLNKTVIDWEGSTQDIIKKRNETPNFTNFDNGLIKSTSPIRLDLSDHMVEQGPMGMPTWTGILALLNHISSEATSLSYQVEGDVLINQNNIAFLIGGNHSVLKYVSGVLKPSPISLATFNSNIKNRLRYCTLRGISYQHVIFPDKQSVLTKEFPIQPVLRLGDQYYNSLDDNIRHYVLWPADDLKLEKFPVFLPLDTHLNDYGSLVVLKLILSKIGISAVASLSHIQSCISQKQRWMGDLGSKMNPPMFQDGIRLQSDWNYCIFRSPGGFNDGMIDIVLNPKAPISSKLLIFGDSFFRMMLTHLSAVFQQVVCLRTRYLHPEMVSLIKPNIILSGNAERYLSNVASDSEAPEFHSLREKNMSSPNKDLHNSVRAESEFRSAWEAVTSPDSATSKSFFANIKAFK